MSGKMASFDVIWRHKKQKLYQLVEHANGYLINVKKRYISLCLNITKDSINLSPLVPTNNGNNAKDSFNLQNACRTGVTFCVFGEQWRKRGERETRVARVGRSAKKINACPHTIELFSPQKHPKWSANHSDKEKQTIGTQRWHYALSLRKFEDW